MVLVEVVVSINFRPLVRASTTMNHIHPKKGPADEASAKLYEGTPMDGEELFMGDPDSGYKQHTPLPMF